MCHKECSYNSKEIETDTPCPEGHICCSGPIYPHMCPPDFGECKSAENCYSKIIRDFKCENDDNVCCMFKKPLTTTENPIICKNRKK